MKTPFRILLITLFLIVSGFGCNYSITFQTSPTPFPEAHIILITAEGTYQVPLEEGIKVENLIFINKGEMLDLIFEDVGPINNYPEDKLWVTKSWLIQRLDNNGTSAVFQVSKHPYD